MEKQIARRLVGWGMGVAVILGILMASIQIAVDYRVEYRDNIALLDKIILVASSGAEQAAQQRSDRLAAEVIGPLLAYDFISIAEIVDRRGATLGRVSRSPEWTAADRVMDAFTNAYINYSKSLLNEDGSTQIGELNVVVHTGTMLRDFYSRALSLMITGVLKNVLLVAVLVFVFNRLLTRPLTAIIQKLRAVDPRNPEPFSVPDDIKHAANELTTLAETTNSILSSNKAYLGEIAELSRQRDATNEKLQHAERLSAIGQLVGGVSHDFNNILSVISGASDLMSEAGPNIDQQDMLATIRRAADKGSNLTAQLLAYSRKQPLAPSALSAIEVCSDVREMLRTTLGKGYAVDLGVIDPDLHCMADRQQLDRVLMNLSLNARDAMAAGGTITIDAQNVDLDADSVRDDEDVAPGPFVCFSVSDHGSGMTADTIAHAFEPYFTTKGVGFSTKGARQGSGLGLAMAYGFAKQSKGHIAIESQPECGTTVRLYLPRASCPDDVSPDNTQIGKDMTALFRDKTILIVEDDPAVLSVVQHQVTALGIRSVCASSPEDALEAFRNHGNLDAALLDVILGSSMTGTRLAEIFRQQRPAFKVAFMSGYSVDEFEDYNPEAKGDLLLTKPFSKAQLIEALETVLSDRSAAPQH